VLEKLSNIEHADAILRYKTEIAPTTSITSSSQTENSSISADLIPGGCPLPAGVK
jgi:hypothetical protein